jgi:hypothetical protein
MISRVLGAMMLILLAGCAGTQQRQATAQVQAIAQSCIQRMQSDRDLDPIRTKIELTRTIMSGAPPPAMLADQSRPTPDEGIAIAKWNGIREACVQEEMAIWNGLSLPANLEPKRGKLVLTLRQANERTGLLVAALYEGRLTYGQFAAERMKTTDQAAAALTGKPSSATPEQPNFVASPRSLATSEDEITLKTEGAGYLVPVSVNGLPPMNFRLDTGADIVALPAEVVFTLMRTGTLRTSDFIGQTGGRTGVAKLPIQDTGTESRATRDTQRCWNRQLNFDRSTTRRKLPFAIRVLDDRQSAERLGLAIISQPSFGASSIVYDEAHRRTGGPLLRRPTVSGKAGLDPAVEPLGQLVGQQIGERDPSVGVIFKQQRRANIFEQFLGFGLCLPFPRAGALRWRYSGGFPALG